jgi:hypothetical protein
LTQHFRPSGPGLAIEDLSRYLMHVIPDSDGYITVMYAFTPKDGLRPNQNKLPLAHRAYKTVDEAVKGIVWIQSRSSNKDIWVCMTRQREAHEATGKNSYMYLKGVRLAENAVAVKSLWLDIDCKDSETGYPSLEAAADAIARFIDDSKMVRPTVIVRSGGGLHVYWTFDRALTPQAWYALASALVEATKRHGLKCDTEVTTDAARVLRPPETLNYKTDPPRPVTMAGTGKDYTVDEITRALEPYKVLAAFMAGDKGLYAFVENPAEPPLLGSVTCPLASSYSCRVTRCACASTPSPTTRWTGISGTT